MSNSNVSEASKRGPLSTKLLQGWTLLAENCPKSSCHVPLLRNRRSQTYCVDCKTYDPQPDSVNDREDVDSLDGGGAGDPGRGQSGGGTAAEDEAFFANSSSSRIETLAGSPRSPAQSPARSPARSQLQASSLSSSSSPTRGSGTIRASSGGGGGGSSWVNERNWDATARSEAATSRASTSSPGRAAGGGFGGGGGGGSGSGFGGGSGDDNSSGKIAEKLLQGWTLLNDICPRPDCFVPLCRSRDQRQFCVSCNAYILTEEQAEIMQLDMTAAGRGGGSAGAEAHASGESKQQQQQQQQQPQPSSHNLVTIRDVPRGEDAWAAAAASIGAGGRFDDAPEEVSGTAAAATTVTSTGGGEGGGGPSSSSSSAAAAVAAGQGQGATPKATTAGATVPRSLPGRSTQLTMTAMAEDLAGTLFGKIDACRRALETTSDVEQCKEILSLINACLTTVEHVRQAERA